jgi:hypothetical protein
MQAVFRIRTSVPLRSWVRQARSALERRIVRRLVPMLHWGPNPRQNRLVILVAVATDQFLMGAKCRHPSPDFFAQAGVTHGRKGDGERFDTGRGLGGRIDRRRFEPGIFNCGIFNCGIFKPGACLRRPRIDGSRERHGLRDQKIVLLLPIHGEPPAGSNHSKKPAINQAAGFRSPTKSVQERWINSSINPGAAARCRKRLWRWPHTMREVLLPQ